MNIKSLNFKASQGSFILSRLVSSFANSPDSKIVTGLTLANDGVLSTSIICRLRREHFFGVFTDLKLLMFICLYAYITQDIYKFYAYTLLWLCELTKPSKRRTTIVVDDELWKRFLTYVVKKHGVAKKASVEVEAAIREYLNGHKDQQKS